MAVAQLSGEVVVLDRASGRQCFRISGGSVAFSPDSRTMAVTAPKDGTLALDDTQTGLELWKTQVGWGTSTGQRFSPNGKTIITEQGGALRFSDSDSGQERFGSPEAHQAEVTFVQYAPDGRAIFTASDDGTVRAWDAARGASFA